MASSAEKPANTMTERLLDVEASQMTVGPAISTVTFLRGSRPEATTKLQAKFAAVVAANPWLAGALFKQSGKLHLSYPAAPSEAQVAALFDPTKRGGKSPAVPVLDSKMGFVQICSAISGSAAEILKGSACIGNDEPLTALSVFPDAKRPMDTFVVVFSVSHVIVDGFTYYRLLSMLSSGCEVAALNPVRKHDIGPQGTVAMGVAESKFSTSKALICNVVCGMMCGKKALIESYYVDPAKVAAAKAQVAGQDGVSFVSTNDVLCSRFGNATEARAFLMPLNFRGRLPDFTEADAGNYEGCLAFGPEDYVDPTLIRKTLQAGPPTFLRGGGGGQVKPLPGCCESTRCRLSMLTNWTFPCFSEMQVDGCEQMLHLPHCNVDMIPFDVAVVYRPHADQLALAIFVRTLSSKMIKAELPVGGMVSSAEEGFAQSM